MFQNLKNKLADKPKLKKVIIILKKIINALVYVFAIFMALLLTIGSSCSNSRSPLIYNNNAIQTNQIVKQDNIIKNVVMRDNNIIIGAGERSSLEGLYSVQYWARNVEPYYADWANANGNVTMYRNLLQDVPIGVSNNMDNVIYISQIGASGEPTTIFNARRIRFRSYVVNAQNFRRWYYYIGLGNDGNNEEYGIEWNIFTDISGTTQYGDKTPLLFNCNFMHVQDYNIWNSVSITYLEETDYALSFKNNSTLYQMYYLYLADDADLSYNNGYNTGLSQGYQVGYDAGYAQSQSDNTLDIFTIITQGFSAVSSLLNISLFPGLTLGTLIFLPTAIVVVIAIFHIFKG